MTGDDLKDICNISGSCFSVPVVPLSRAGICRKQKKKSHFLLGWLGNTMATNNATIWTAPEIIKGKSLNN